MKKFLGCFLCVMLLFCIAAPAGALTTLVTDYDPGDSIDVNALWYNENDTNGDFLKNSSLATESLWLNALLGQGVGDSNWVDLVGKNDPYDGTFDPGNNPIYAVLKYGNGQAPTIGGVTGEHWAVYYDGNGGFDFTEVGLTTHALSHLSYSAVPEPATLLLLGAGLVGLAGFGRKKFKK